MERLVLPVDVVGASLQTVEFLGEEEREGMSLPAPVPAACGVPGTEAVCDLFGGMYGGDGKDVAGALEQMVEVHAEIRARNARIDALWVQALREQQRRRGLEWEPDGERRTGIWNALREERDLTFDDTPNQMARGLVRFTQEWHARNEERHQQALEAGTPFAGAGAYFESFGEVSVEGIEQSLDFTQAQIEELLAANGAGEAAYHALGAGLGLFEATMGAGSLASPLAAATDVFMAGGGGVGPLLSPTGEAVFAAEGALHAPMPGGAPLLYEAEEIALEHAAEISRETDAQKCFGEGPDAERMHETNTEHAGVKGEHPRAGENGRPSVRDSEEIRGAEYLKGHKFDYQQSLKEGDSTRYATKNSTRPDYYSKDLRLSVDVKNYNIATVKGRRRLVNDIVSQAHERARHLPAGTHQAVLIETLGIEIGAEELNMLKEMIAQKSDGLVAIDDIGFLGED